MKKNLFSIAACLTLVCGVALGQTTASQSKAPLPAAVPGILAYGSTSTEQSVTQTLTQSGSANPMAQSGASIPQRLAYRALASVIPTPGLTSSSVCGTTGVRCAADAHFAASGQGEILNQSRQADTPSTAQFGMPNDYPNRILNPSSSPARPKGSECDARIASKAKPARDSGAVPSAKGGGDTTSSTAPIRIQDDYPNLLPLPFQPLFSPAALAAYNPSCTPGVSYYQVAHETDTVFKIATCPLAVLKEIPVCSNPLQAQSTPDGTTIVVTCYDNAVAFIDTATDNVTTLNTPLYYPNGVDITPDGSTAYIASYIDTSAVIFSVNMATRQLNPQTVTVDSFPKNVFLTPDGAQLWVGFYQSPSLYVIDTLSMTVSGTVSVPGTADNGIAFTPDGKRAYVAIEGGSVSVFDTATLTQIASIPVSDQPSGVVVSKDGSRVYVDSNASNNPMFSVIDVASNTVIATYPQIGTALGFIIFN